MNPYGQVPPVKQSTIGYVVAGSIVLVTVSFLIWAVSKRK